MRCRSNKVLAAIMAAAMLFSQSGTAVTAKASDVSEEWNTEAQAFAELYEEDGLAGDEYQENDPAEDPVVGEEPQAEEPQTEPPQTEPPQTEPPQTEPPQTEPPQTEPPQTEPPQTEPPQTEAPQTEAPQTEAPQTEAPQTEAPQTEAPQTEAPQTEAPQTEAPQTEAPQTEAPQTEQPGTEPLLPADLIEIPEEDTEETEALTEVMTDHFQSSGDGLSVDVQLTGGDLLPETAWVEVTWLDAARQGAGYNVLLEQELAHGHRVLAGAEFFRIRIMDGENELHPQNAMHVVIRFDYPSSLGLSPYMEGEAAVYQMEPWMEALGRPGLEYDENGVGWLYAAEIDVPEGAVIAFAGVQNRRNTGDELTGKEIEKELELVKYFVYPILTNELEDPGNTAETAVNTAAGNLAGESFSDTFSGMAEEGSALAEPETGIHTFSGEDEPAFYGTAGSAPDREEIRRMLEDLSDISLKLANATSSVEYEVINLYADEYGSISLTPVIPVLDETGNWLDVTEKRILINIVAYDSEQPLELPIFEVRDDDRERKEKLPAEDAYARVLYNVTAWENGRFVPYKGKAVMKEAAGGTWILPEGSLTVEKALLGAALTDKMTLKEEAVFQTMLFSWSDELLAEETILIPEFLPDGIGEEGQEQPDAGTDHTAGEVFEEELTITTDNGNWVYDGQEHFQASCKVTFDGQAVAPNEQGIYELDTGDRLILTVFEAQAVRVKNVADTPAENKISGLILVELKDSEGTTIAADEETIRQRYPNYSLQSGTLTITQRPVTFTGESAAVTYDGTLKALTGITPNKGENEGLLEGHTFDLNGVSYLASGTDAASYTGTFTNPGAELIRDKDGQDVTSNYLITEAPGTLTITQRPVTFTGESASVTYDGTLKALTGITPNKGENEGLLEGHTFDLNGVSYLASGTDAGSYIGTFTNPGAELIRDKDGNDVTANYKITEAPGTLTVTQRPVTFTGESAAVTYDGALKALTGITPDEGENEGLAADHSLNTEIVSYLASGTNAGSYVGKFTIKGTALILDKNGNDVTANYKADGSSFVPGTLTITPKEHEEVTVTVDSWYGTDKTNPFEGAAVYRLADVEGTVLKSSSGKELEALTNANGIVTWTFDPAEYGVFANAPGTKESVSVQVLAEVPEGFYANRTEYPLTITRDANGNIKINKTAEFYYRDLLTDFTIMLSAEVKSSSSKSGYSYLAAEFTLKDEAGNAILGTDKKPLTASVTSDGATALVVDPANYPALSSALASGKEVTFTVEETTVPAGYFVNPVKQLILWQDKYGNVRVRRSTAAKAATGNVLNFRYIHKLLRTYLTVTAADKDDEKTPLPGAAYVIRMSDGTLVGITWVNSDGETKRSKIAHSLGESKNSLAHLAVIDLRLNAALEERLKEKGKATLTVSELTPPTKAADGKDATYKIYGSPDYKVTLTYDRKTGGLAFDTKTIRMLNEKKSSGETTNSDQIQVIKKQYEGNSSIYIPGGAVYYMALFSDAKRKNRVSEIRTIRFVKGAVTEASTTFTGLEPGTYYVGETDQYGKLVGTEKKEKKATDPYYVEYDVDSVEIQGTTSRTHTVTASNHYFKMPDGAAYFAQLTVQKQLKDEKGADKASSGQFFFYVFSENGSYPLGTKEQDGKIVRPEPYVIAMNGASAGEKTISLSMPQETRTLRIREVDEDGNLLKNGDKYKITYSAQNGAVTLTRSQTQPALLTITNQEVGEKESEEAGEATLTLTKRVTYKGSPMRVNAAYYIGIFKSEDIKKSNLLGTVSTSVRAIALRNSSQESSKPMTVRLDKVATHEVTLYFAETDREGNPVTSGTSTGYNISINGQSGNVAKVTLNAKNPKAEVVVTNDIISGGAQEQRLLNSSSGFAGDRTALAEAQEISNDATAGVASRTGDDTPILPLLGILGGSAAVILLAVLILRRRRK